MTSPEPHNGLMIRHTYDTQDSLSSRNTYYCTVWTVLVAVLHTLTVVDCRVHGITIFFYIISMYQGAMEPINYHPMNPLGWLHNPILYPHKY